jgi:hypothetical protein
MLTIQSHAYYSYDSGFAFEAISCRVLILDFMLRAFIVHRSGKPISPYSKQDRTPFGKLIEKAKKHGLPPDLATDLYAFNEKRNDGIHHFLMGQATYQEIGDAFANSEGLFERIGEAINLPAMEDR